MLEEAEQKDNIKCIRRDRDSRGGGVAIAFDSSRGDFKKLCLKTMVNKKFEIVAAIGKLHGVKKAHSLSCLTISFL